MREVFRFLFNIYALIAYRPKVLGKENIPEGEGALICPNHIHALDSVLVVAQSKRKINCLAKHDLFDKGIAKWFANVCGIYPIKRDSADMYAIKVSLKLLKNKELLMMFPEATRNGLKKNIKPKNGAVSIACKANVPIIPVGIQGNFKLFRRVIINIGKPIYYNEGKESLKDKEHLDKLTSDLMEQIIKLRDEKINLSKKKRSR